MKNSIFQLLVISLFLTACGGDGGEDSGGNSGVSGGGDAETSIDDLSGPPTGTLTWTIPTARTDGSPLLLSDIAAYQLCYFINNSAENCETIKIDDPSQDSYFMDNLEQGQYLITLAVIDQNGIFGEKSETVEYLVE